MSRPIGALKAMTKAVTPQARNAVRRAFRERPDAYIGLPSQEIWKLIHGIQEDPIPVRPTKKIPTQSKRNALLSRGYPTLAQFPDHPVPSMRSVVLFVVSTATAVARRLGCRNIWLLNNANIFIVLTSGTSRDSCSRKCRNLGRLSKCAYTVRVVTCG